MLRFVWETYKRNMYVYYISATVPPCFRVLLPETLHRNQWRSGRATAQNKSLKVTILRGYRNPEIENSHPSAAKSLLLLKMCVLCRAGSPGGGRGTLPPGGPKNHGIFDVFSKAFRMGFGRALGRQNDPTVVPRTRKGSEKATLGCLLADF